MNPLLLHRISRFLYLKKVPLLPKVLKALNFFLFNCVLPPQCAIGKGTKLWHSGLGIVLHPKAVIGEGCNIYNFVVLGGAYDGPDGPPIRIEVGKNCNISAGVKILCKSGTLSIGDGTTVAANAVVLESLPANVIAGGIPAKVLKVKEGTGCECSADK